MFCIHNFPQHTSIEKKYILIRRWITWKKWFPRCFSRLSECCDTVSLWSSTNVLRSMNLSPDFPSAWGWALKRSFSGWTYPLTLNTALIIRYVQQQANYILVESRTQETLKIVPTASLCAVAALRTDVLNKTCYWPDSLSPVIDFEITSLSFHYVSLFGLPLSEGMKLISRAGGLIQLKANYGRRARRTSESQPTWRLTCLVWKLCNTCRHLLSAGSVTFEQMSARLIPPSLIWMHRAEPMQTIFLAPAGLH